jgi:uncharacterized protein (DUF1697 family)
VGAPTTFAGFLRAVNVAGRVVAMADLKRSVEALGGSNVRTVLNSGNVVFGWAGRDAREVERRLEAGLAESLGGPVELLVRDLPALEGAIAANPFPGFARTDPSHLLVVFLRSAPSAARAAAFPGALPGPEEGRAVGAHAYVTYPEGIGRSKLTLPRIEAALGTRGTARNWNTVRRTTAIARGTDVPEREGG